MKNLPALYRHVSAQHNDVYVLLSQNVYAYTRK